jgi:uncharacterized RDD family membrane protein YckC
LGGATVAAELASRRDRVRAGFVDGVLFLPLLILDRYMADAGWGVGPTLAYFLISWQLGWVYSTTLHGCRGRTVGKAVYRIRVVRYRDRGRLGWTRAFVRDLPYVVLIWLSSAVWTGWNVAYLMGLESPEMDEWADRLLDGLVYVNFGWMGLELVTMALHPERRAIHDLLAGSIVVNDPPLAANAAPAPETSAT